MPQIGYWDSTVSAKDLRVTGSEYVRGNITLTNGTSISSDYVMMLSSGATHDILLRCGSSLASSPQLLLLLLLLSGWDARR
eukprot:SAG25_NODE_406_length_8436_cov_11.691976_4_plen_81_part_00